MDLAASPNRDLMLHGASTAHPYFSSLLEGKCKLFWVQRCTSPPTGERNHKSEVVRKFFLVIGKCAHFQIKDFFLPCTNSTLIPQTGFCLPLRSDPGKLEKKLKNQLLTAMYLELELLQALFPPAAFSLLLCPQLAALNHILVEIFAPG